MDLHVVIGGGGEIRTHERLPFAGFQDQCNRPLCHTSSGLPTTFSRLEQQTAPAITPGDGPGTLTTGRVYLGWVALGTQLLGIFKLKRSAGARLPTQGHQPRYEHAQQH